MPTDVKITAYGKTDQALDRFQNIFQLHEDDAAAGCTVSLGSSLAESASQFDAAAYFGALTSRSLGHVLLHTRSIGSTQEWMRRHAGVLPEGVVLVADQQSSGRGRGGNQWVSPDGCLMFSAARGVRVPGTQAAFINYVVCLAVVQGIDDVAAAQMQAACPGVAIKWPNDIYALQHDAGASGSGSGSSGGGGSASGGGGAVALKIGGALIHTSYKGDRFNCLTGIGINVSNRQPTTCLEAIFEQQQSGSASVSVPKEVLLASIMNRLEECYDVFERSGFAPLEIGYLSRWMHSNQRVDLLDDGQRRRTSVVGIDEDGSAASDTDSGRRVRLTITGLTSAGFLLAVDDAGARYELTPDGNSLDMMQGLLKRKLPT